MWSLFSTICYKSIVLCIVLDWSESQKWFWLGIIQFFLETKQVEPISNLWIFWVDFGVWMIPKDITNFTISHRWNDEIFIELIHITLKGQINRLDKKKLKLVLHSHRSFTFLWEKQRYKVDFSFWGIHFSSYNLAVIQFHWIWQNLVTTTFTFGI